MITTTKLIFKDGNADKIYDKPAEEVLTKEAINVCRLLAIDPEDILKRDKK